MASTLRDDLASLKIDRRRDVPRGSRGRDEGGFGLLAAVLWLIPLSLLGVVGAVGYRQYDLIRSKPEVSVGLVQTMTTGEAEKLLSAKGYLKSRYQAMIGAKVPGRVERMFVEEGARVKKGQTLAVLEHNDLKAHARVRGKASLSAARPSCSRPASTSRRRSARRGARPACTRARRSPLEEFEKADAAREMCVARVAALEAAITLTEANIEETEETIRNMSLFAPFDGTVVEKQGEEGEVITPSAMSASTGRSAVVSLADLSKMEVETDVAENLLSRVALGQPAEISVSAVPSKHYRGRLRQIIPMGDRTRGTVKVKVEILDPDEHLFPELVATVHFLPDKALNNPDASRSFLFVPKAALFEENGHEYRLGRRRASDVSAKRRVEVAVTNDELARVESGLKRGRVGRPESLQDPARQHGRQGRRLNRPAAS